ncbi:hypothetical protein P43SY_000258 [Pythium insidiosum]|uniref:HhH-GPD domain-containing protein n=1 Tax=Pythium insidiosum TaxID=114742 RepID=A0AAD5M826_PYTIN|nr:hypothetical protein P43SY_000258 [Pythium insidiosum]
MALQVNRAQSNAMNLQVLKRQDDAIMEIVEMASHVVVYEFEQSSQSWKRKDVEGCLFVVKRYSSPRFQIFVINRLSTINLTIAINDSLEVDSVDSFLILRSPDAALQGGYAIFGLWFFPEEDREKILKLVQRIAQNTRTEPPTSSATPVVKQQQQQQSSKAPQQQEQQQQQQPREGRRQSRQNKQKREQKQQQQEQNAANGSAPQPQQQQQQPPASTSSSTSSRSRRGKRDSDASQKAKTPTSILQRPAKQSTEATTESAPGATELFVRNQVSVQEPVAQPTAPAYTPISREEGIAAGNAILGMLAQSNAPHTSSAPVIPAVGPVLVPPSVVMGAAVTSALAPRPNSTSAARAEPNASPVSKEQLKQTLISLLDEPQFFDQIYHAYVSRVQLSRAMAANPFARFSLHAKREPRSPEDSRVADVAAASAPKRVKREQEREQEQEHASAQHQELLATSTGPGDATREDKRECHEEDVRVKLLQQLIAAREQGPPAPIDRFGTQACLASGVAPDTPTGRFQILVAALLSSQTQDGVTHGAMQRLHAELGEGTSESQGLSIAGVRGVSTARLEELLNPVGFYRRKAQDKRECHEEDVRVKLLQQLIAAREQGPPAPIDRFGTQACLASGVAPDTPTGRFQILVAALLSSQTQDGVTHGAMQRLHAELGEGTSESQGLSIAGVRGVSTARLEELLNPVGFYRRKAQHIKKIAETLQSSYRGDIPRTLDELEALPGIGPKIARVILLLAWNDDDAGLIVDTHVHRLAQRLGWVSDSVERAIKTPEDTRAALEEWVPRAYWRGFSRHVVGFGQMTVIML